MKKIVNTVPAENQMIKSSEISFLGDPNAPLKILILGNSITRHGPAEVVIKIKTINATIDTLSYAFNLFQIF